MKYDWWYMLYNVIVVKLRIKFFVSLVSLLSQYTKCNIEILKLIFHVHNHFISRWLFGIGDFHLILLNIFL